MKSEIVRIDIIHSVVAKIEDNKNNALHFIIIWYLSTERTKVSSEHSPARR